MDAQKNTKRIVAERRANAATRQKRTLGDKIVHATVVAVCSGVSGCLVIILLVVLVVLGFIFLPLLMH